MVCSSIGKNIISNCDIRTAFFPIAEVGMIWQVSSGSIPTQTTNCFNNCLMAIVKYKKIICLLTKIFVLSFHERVLKSTIFVKTNEASTLCL